MDFVFSLGLKKRTPVYSCQLFCYFKIEKNVFILLYKKRRAVYLLRYNTISSFEKNPRSHGLSLLVVLKNFIFCKISI